MEARELPCCVHGVWCAGGCCGCEGFEHELKERIHELEAELSHIRNWAGMVCDDDVTREQNLLGIAKIAADALKRT